MSKTIEKVVRGPLTAAADSAPGVTFKLPDDSEFSIDLSSLSQDMLTRLAVHGLSQKIGDSYASAGKAENPLAYAKEAIQETIEQLTKGEWRIVSAGGAPRVTQLARAVARAFGITVEAAQATFTEREEALSEEDYKAFVKQVRDDAKVKKALVDIKAEDAAAAAAKVQAGGGESSLAGVFGAN